MLYGYAWVRHTGAIVEETLDHHEQTLRSCGAQKVIREAGWRNGKRPAFDSLVARLVPGDKLLVISVSRLGRDMNANCRLMLDLKEKGVEVCCLKEGLSTSSQMFPALVKIWTEAIEADS